MSTNGLPFTCMEVVSATLHPVKVSAYISIYVFTGISGITASRGTKVRPRLMAEPYCLSGPPKYQYVVSGLGLAVVLSLNTYVLRYTESLDLQRAGAIPAFTTGD